MSETIRVTIWNENRHESREEHVREIYPRGIHGAIAEGITGNFIIRTVTMDEPDHGLPQEVLEETDVLVWWGHIGHRDLSEEIADNVVARVRQGMGFVALHSAHYSKPFKSLMGTTCSLIYRDVAEKERLWVTAPAHPIVEGIGPYFELPHEEMYGEFFDIPAPDEVVLTGWFEGGNVFRSGCTFTRGMGKIFYFQPGHQLYPTYYDSNVRRIISNAIRWVAPVKRPLLQFGKSVPALEPIQGKED